MRLGLKTLSPLFRALAALGLVAFVAAQTLCVVHCNFRAGHNDDARPCCRSVASTTSSHGHQGSPPSSAGTPCLTFKTMLAGGDASALAAPKVLPLDLVLISISPSLDETVARLTSLTCCQAKARHWVFTLEVCLGPAHGSHAPPSLS